ncbi:transglutaminase-like domain-containing protein [Streptomyces chilikensis]|uniref:transglutaminase-like domain-containing protein n=1 Tax=Streptomyces chilikensis TaxID=1194079 RepID=UPI00140794BF|nr:transglutaminase-like domain-containing protein [Streptomyces chilikensis]
MLTPDPPVPAGPEQRARWAARFAAEARAERPDLVMLCLLIGAVADGSFDEAGMDEAQMELDRLAGRLPYRPGGPREWAEAVRRLLGEAEGFGGAEADYRDLRSSLLHEVLRRRRGLPILLSVVWTEVARRAGAPVHGVALPGHFVVGFGPADAPARQVLVDPFAGGRLLTGADAELLVLETTGTAPDPADPSVYAPARPLEVVVRILNNVRAWAAARPEQSATALWALELSLLLPSRPANLRYEYAQLLVARGEFMAGAEELEVYADVVEAVDEELAERVRGQARSARARLN